MCEGKGDGEVEDRFFFFHIFPLIGTEIGQTKIKKKHQSKCLILNNLITWLTIYF